MAITRKEAAEISFQKAVALEKKQRKQGLQNFDGAINLYDQAIKLDPNHAGAMNNLACLYLERKSEDPNKIEDYRTTAKEYYEKAVKLLLPGVQHNLRLLDMVIRSDVAKEFTFSARSYEKGREDKGIPNPDKAIEMYTNAKDTYNRLIDFLDAELARIRAINIPTPNIKLARYEKMLAYNKQLADKRMASLENRIRENSLYMARLECEAKVGIAGKPDYDSAIKEHKKAVHLEPDAAETTYHYPSKSTHLHERDEENPNTAPDQPLQKMQKTTDSSSTLIIGGMFSTVPALASGAKKPTFGAYAIAGNRHTTFSTPSILGGGQPLKRQKTGVISQGMSASS